MIVLSSLLLGLARAAYFPLSNVQYPVYHPKDRVEIYAPNDGFKQLVDSNSWSVEAVNSDNELNAVQLSCEVVQEKNFRLWPSQVENDEPLPLTKPGAWYLSCTFSIPEDLVNDGEYFLRGQFLDDERLVSYESITFSIDEDRQPRKNRFVTDMFTDVELAKKRPRVSSLVRNGPSISGLAPSTGSPLGQIYLTIYGDNLKSQQIDLGGTSDAEETGEGENYQVWGEREGDRVDCHLDRMLTLHGRPLNGAQFVVCLFPAVPFVGRWYIKMTIDGGDTLSAGSININEGYAPKVYHFYPSASAPARPRGSWDYDGAFWTSWYNTDTPADGIEEESFTEIYSRNRADFQHCTSPVKVQAWNTELDEEFLSTVNVNADGRCATAYFSAFEGVRCDNSLQSIETITCPDIKVRFYCVPGITEVWGRQFTDVVARLDDEDFHANRIHEQPKVVDDNDGFKSELKIFLNDGQNCGSHENCGQSHELQVSLKNGNDGIIQMLPKAPIPGAYNFTYQTHHQGRAYVHGRYANWFGNEDLLPTSFEIYPQINSVSPQIGSVNGGAILTVTGTGFISDGKGGTVTVQVGGVDCEVLSMTETEIKCRVAAGEEAEGSWYENRQFVSIDGFEGGHYKYFSEPTGDAEKCEDLCRRDARCMAWVWETKDDCDLYDYVGEDVVGSADFPTTADWIAANWGAETDAFGGYFNADDHAEETDCFSGRGHFYNGTATAGRYDGICAAGTFCRNPTPQSHVMPYCQTDEGHWRDCQIRRCSEKTGAFIGNRGFDVQGARGHLGEADLQWKHITAKLEQKPELHHRDLDGLLMGGKFSNSQKHLYGEEAEHQKYWNLRGRSNFIAPLDGVYKFIFSADDDLAASSEVDQSSGEWKEIGLVYYHCGEADKFCRAWDSAHSDFITLTKGEVYPLQVDAANIGGPGYAYVGIQYLGTDGSGTWHDEKRDEDENLYLEAYIDARQDIFFKQDRTRDQQWINVAWDEELQDNGVGLGAGETFDDDVSPRFGMEICGDDYCVDTGTLAGYDKDHPDDFEETVRGILEPYFSQECTKRGSMNPIHFQNDYEQYNYWPDSHRTASMGGWCGKNSLRTHQWDIFHHSIQKNGRTAVGPANGFETGDFCFAHRGDIDNIWIYVRYSYIDTNGNEQFWQGWQDVAITGHTDNEESWQWGCWNALELADSHIAAKGWGHVRSDTQFLLYHIQLRNKEVMPIFVDEFVLGKMREAYSMEVTRPQLKQGGTAITKVDVDKFSRTGGSAYRFTWNNYHDYPVNGYVTPLIKIKAPTDVTLAADSDAATDTSGNDFTSMTPLPRNVWDDNVAVEEYYGYDLQDICTKDYLYGRFNYVNSDNVRHILQVHVFRKSWINEDTRGEMTVTYGDSPTEVTLPFGSHISQYTIQNAFFEAWPELQDDGLKVRVYREGSPQWGVTWRIQAHERGQMKTFAMTYTLNTNGRHQNFRSGVSERTRAGIFSPIIPGSMIATSHDQPQVVIVANGQRSACDNCDFRYSNAHTVAVTSVSVAEGDAVSMGDSITVNFNANSYSGTLNNANIHIGGIPSTGCSATASTVTCEAGQVPVGSWEVILHIPENGDAPSGVSVSVSSSVDSSTPTTGSNNGGQIVTATGSGFKAGQVVQVSMNGEVVDCDSTGFEVSYDTLVCRTVAHTDCLPGCAGPTPVLDSVSITALTVIGGETITLTGNGFSSSCADENGSVMIGDATATVLSWSDSEIVARTGAMTATSSAGIKVDVCGVGFSDTVAGTTELKIQGIGGAYSSLNGGRLITINGAGFAHDESSIDDVSVMLGDDVCEVSSVEYGQIVCKSAGVSTRHRLIVGAGGIMDAAGSMSGTTTIEVGDEIEWWWNINIGGAVPKFEFERTNEAGSVSTGGAKWSPAIHGEQNSFIHQFVAEGTYHYSTGYIDGATIFQTGTIVVVGATDKAARVSVVIGDNEAAHVASRKVKNQPSGNCNSVAGVTSTAASVDSDHYVFYSLIATPRIVGFTINNQAPFEHSSTPVNAEVVVDFDDFDVDNCGQHVIVEVVNSDGVYPCSGGGSGTEYTCTIDPSAGLSIYKDNKLRISIATMGEIYFLDYNVVSDDDTFSSVLQIDEAFELDMDSAITAINPAPISLLGDVELTISGFGFACEESSESFSVSYDGTDASFACSTISAAYDEVICHLQRIAVDPTSDSRPSEFSVTGDWGAFATLSASDSMTPKITEVVVSADKASITVTGTDLDALIGSIDGESFDCSGGSCSTPSVGAGLHDIFWRSTAGAANFVDASIEIVPEVSTVSPTSGGSKGGFKITITGNGFDDDTIVSFTDEFGAVVEKYAYKTIESASSIVVTSPSGEGSYSLSVTHEFLDTANAPVSITLAAVDSSITSTSDVSAVVGGDSVTVSGSFLDCENTNVEFSIYKDPCATGNHHCHYNAECIPDGFSYVCSCIDANVDEWWGQSQWGDGFTCHHIDRPTACPIEEAVEKCAGDRRQLFRLNTAQDRLDFIDIVSFSGGVSRGYWVEIDGVLTCATVNEAGDAVLTAEDLGACDTWGADVDGGDVDKRPLCTRYTQDNCYDDNVDYRGRYTYNGRMSKTLAGDECFSWDITGDSTYSESDNFCRNPHWSSNGPSCYTGMNNNGVDYNRLSCNVPSCAVLKSRDMNNCILSSWGAIDYDNVHDSATNTYERCWIGSVGGGDELNNPRKCYDGSGDERGINFIPVDASRNIYAMRFDNDNDFEYFYSSGDLVKRANEADNMTPDRAEAQFVVEPDFFGPGKWAIRQGDVHWRSRPSNYGDLKFEVINLDEAENTDEYAWKIQCRRSSFGALIEQPTAPNTIVSEQPLTCSGDFTGDVSISMPALPAGSYKMNTRGASGISDIVDVNYALTVSSISPNSAGAGGGTEITLSGNGFSESTSVILCDNSLEQLSVTNTEAVFMTVPVDMSNCTIVFSVVAINAADDSEIVASGFARNLFTIDESLSPTISAVNPKRGGTAGGTQLTITGSGFGSSVADTSVTVANSECAVSSVSDSEIVCETGIFDRSQVQEPVMPIVTIAGGPGQAVADTDAAEADMEFWYIDRWSSPYTWGCTDESCKPKEGEIIVIPAGQVILLDETTPVLAVLIVDGGKFIWDRQDGIELHMQYGVINNGGSFEIGTEEEPFCEGNAMIQLYGHQRSINLPIYGAKVLAVRFGSLDFHGCPKTTTWTELDQTAEAGDSQIVLTHPVKDDWFVGNEIIIAATGDITNFHRSEKRVIQSVSEDGYTVTLTEALEHRHFAVCSDGPSGSSFGWGWAGSICTRAEVGLLTRNILFRGNFEESWAEELEECELGVGTAFGTQTCFQNRFGHETGSDQFGAILFLHKPSHAKIEFTEFTHAGQAFNLARYPIHFHTPGSLPTSYVRGNGIHNTFNRALTMHGVHNLTVEYNVIYNVMGLAFFLEDAVEEDNILRYNLGIMNKKSSSLLNIDSTPAVFWIPNPNNIFYGNRAAGGTHFGFWFNPSEEPTGPSAQMEEYQNFCVKNRPLGAFYNNTAHSMGKYGMWIFVDLTPTASGECNDPTPKAIKFGELPAENENGPIPDDTFGFFAWHCERGAEFATGGAIQFHNMITANNWIANLAGKESFLHTYGEPGMEDQISMFKRNIVIGHLDGDPELKACGDMGIETPWKFFAFTVDDIAFYNYDVTTPDLASAAIPADAAQRRCVAFDPCYGSNAFDCGAITWFSNVSWFNSNRRMTHAWEHEAAVLDKDGTFSEGTPGTYVISKSDAYNKNLCSDDDSGKYHIEGSFPAQICEPSGGGEFFKPHRFMFNSASPDSLEGMEAVFTGNHGTAKSPFRNCRPRGNGWMVLLDGNQEYEMHFANMDHISNISFTGDIDDFETGEWLTIRHDFPEKVDTATLRNDDVQVKVEEWPANPLSVDPYTYHVENVTQPYSVRYTFNGNWNDQSPAVDGEALSFGQNFLIRPEFYKCFYKDCIPPPPEPGTAEGELEACNFVECAMNDDYSPLHVQETQHVKFDRTAFMASGGTVKLGETIVDGTFEVEASALQDGETLTIEADNFLINSHTDPNDIGRRRRDTFVYNNGKIVIGTEENPIPCGSQVVLKINGDKNSRSFGATPGNPPIGPKAIGGFGGIEMWGCAPANTWTQLLTTVNAGASAITIMGDITGWKAGDEIAVASTSYEHRHTEYVTIQSISGNVIAIFPALEHRHTGAATSTQTINGVDYNQAAEVTLLTRSIKIDGTDFTDDKVGGRIVIMNWIRMNGAHFYEHHGYGQFSNVQFTGMGQYAYTSYDDNRAAIMFWGIDTTADADLGRKESFVRGCAFHDLYHTAVAALFDTDNLVIDNNIIMGAVDDAIRSDGVGTVITNNVIGNVEATALYKGAFASGTNVNFEEDQLPSCVNIMGATDTTLTGNRCTGTDGSCFQTDGESCDVSEMCGFTTNGYSFSNNVGHSCAIGHWNLFSGSGCAKYAGYYFYKIAYYGFQWQSDIDYNIVEDSVVVDAKVGFYGVSIGIGPDKRNTIKNTYFAGKSDFFDCAYDADVHQNMELSKHAGSLKPSIVDGTQHAAVVFPDFHQGSTGFPICEIFAADVDPNNHGLTCMLDCHFADYNRKCGQKDVLFRTNKKTFDWTFPIQLLGGNQKTNVNMDDLVQYDRPDIGAVNIADCVDLHADANKHAKVMDIDGGVFDVPGTLFAESEYEWDGVTRPTADGGSITYSDTRDGLGDYRIPKPLITAMDGSKLPIDDVIQERGIVRNANCDYRPEGPAWFCPLSDFQYYDLVYDMMDNDKMSRRLTPLALVANGHADIINGPCDHSCCIGYACSLRLMTLHSTVACGQDYDYYFSSTTPLKAKWYFTDAPADCKILVKFYSKRPNRMNFFKDGELSLATNAVIMGDSISWSKPDPSFFPGLTDSIYSHGGANYHDRNNQLFYMILSGGSTYDLEVVSTLVLELGVMTEVTEDEFYDNGNLAANIAALLGIDPSKIRLMNVISETGSQRRKRRAALGYDVINVDVSPRFRSRRQDDAPGMTLGFEIDPSSNTANGAQANNKLGATIAGSGSSIVENVMNTTTAEIDPSATADENVAIAAAPEPPPEEPEEPETLADILGIDNIAEGESLEDFLEKVKEELDVPLEDLETAEEKNAEKQAAADAALEAVVYTSPAELLVLSEPTEPQILGLEFYQKFSFAMKDTNGEIMPIVGFVAEPWNVKVTFGDQVVTSGPASPNLDGLTSVDFVAGDGRSIFSNLVVKGDVVSANFIFTAVNPGIAEDTGISWTSPVVEFLPPADTSVCDAKPEGSPFDKKMAFSPDCSYVCITGCNAVGAAPICETISSCDASSYSACGDSGCACDMDLVPEVESINVADYISGTCDGSGLTMRVNKCVVNKLGLMLKDIHVVGEQADDFSTIVQDANCRGRLGFDNGAEYVFRINRSKSECGATTTFNSTHVSYTAGIQGYKMVSDFYTRDVAEFWSSFECSYPIDLSSYTELATAQKMDNVVEGRNVMVAKYTDAGYHTIAPTDQVISSDSVISQLGMVAPEGFQLEANRCWFSDAYNADDEDAGNTLEVVTDGCLTSGQEGWVSIAEGWSGTSQFRISVTDSIFSDMGSDIVYFNCMVSLCDLDSGACSDATCPGSNTASGTQIRVHAELNLDNADGVAACADNAQNCENCKATMNGDVCFCPDGFVLQGDNSCAASRVLPEQPKKKWQKKWQKKKN